MDLVFASGVFHHIPFRAHDEHLREVLRVLKPGGRFVLFELNPFNPASLYVFLRSPFDRNAKLMFPRYSQKLLERYGRAETKFYAFFPGFLRRLRRFEPYLEKIPLGAIYAVIVETSRL